jgi:hypothetical protein
MVFDLNTVTSYAIRGMEYITPSLRDFKDRIQEDMAPVMQSFTKSDTANARDISTLVLHAMQPIKYLFWSSFMVTCGCYLAEKYTPIFSSVFKVSKWVSAVFTFDMFITYVHTYKEYFYFDARGQELEPNVKWVDFLHRVDDYSRSILSSTFVLSSSRFLSKDVNGGLVALLMQGKEAGGAISTQLVIQNLPGIASWFRVAQGFLE